MEDRRAQRVDDLANLVADSRARLNTAEQEIQRNRDRIHALEADRSAMRMLTAKVDGLTTELGEVAGELRTLGRRAMERPTTAGLTTSAAWCSVVIAVGALLVTILR